MKEGDNVWGPCVGERREGEVVGLQGHHCLFTLHLTGVIGTLDGSGAPRAEKQDRWFAQLHEFFNGTERNPLFPDGP